MTPATTTESAIEFQTSRKNCSNYYCISDEDYVDKLRDYIFPSTFEWIIVVLYAAVFIGGLAGNIDEAPVTHWPSAGPRTWFVDGGLAGNVDEAPVAHWPSAGPRTWFVDGGGLAGNALVCIVVWKNTQMRTVTNLFIVNLSTADLMVVLVCLPPTVVGDITETWFVGRAFCKLIHYLQVGLSVLRLPISHRLPLSPSVPFATFLSRGSMLKQELSTAVAEMADRLTTIDMGRKVGGAVPLSGEGRSWVPI